MNPYVKWTSLKLIVRKFPHVLAACFTHFVFLNFVIDQQHAWTRLAWATRKRRSENREIIFASKQTCFSAFFSASFSTFQMKNKKITSFCRPKLVTVTTVFCIHKQCFSLSSFLYSCCPWFLVSLPDN